MTPVRQGRQPGFVLLFTLAFLVALSLAVLEFHAICVRHVQDLRSEQDAVQTAYLAEIGVAVGQDILADSQESFDWLNSSWATPREIKLGDNQISVTIEDENRRLNLNGILNDKGELNTKLLKVARNLLTVLGYSSDIMDNLLDWVDEDDLPRTLGAESSYYEGLNPPYHSPNRPLRSREELSLVRGFTADLLGGSEEERRTGLLNLVTLWSDSKINVNTCDPVLLQALGFTDDNIAEIVAQRETAPLNETFLLNLNRPVYLENRSLITFASTYFSITATGTTPSGITRQERAVVQKAKDTKIIAVEYP